MKQIRSIFTGFALVTSFFSWGQQTAAGYTDFNNYTPVYCSGEIPSVFLMSAQDKYKQDVKDEVKKSDNKYVSKSKGDFLLKSNYFVDILLQSGKVLFGDSITNYVNTVADRVLVNEPDLRSQLTFYCLRSEEPNAFSTDQGMIFVTVGLIAQLENEAQLAFILSHEIAHYERRHTLTVYMEGQKIFTDNQKSHSISLDDKIRDFSNHEKASEYEADSLGLARLSRTGYDCAEAISAMFVLQFSHLPFDDYDFPSHSYERPMMAFPATIFLDSARAISFDGDSESDEYSSHPNIANRRQRLEEQYADMDACGTEKFAAPQSQFEKIRTICRYEVIRLQIIGRDYLTAIYNATYLLKFYPISLYLNRAIAKSLYCMARYKNEGEYNDGTENYSAIEGKQQACFHVFQRMNAEQLTAVALRTIYDISRKDSSPIIKAMLYDLGTDAVYYHKMTLEAMKKSVNLYNESMMDTAKKDSVPPVAVEKKDTVKQDDNKYVSKYDKLRNEKKKKDKEDLATQKVVEKSKFHMLAFGDIIDDPNVIAFFNTCSDAAAERERIKNEKNKKYEGMSSYEERKARQKEEKKDKAPAPLGIDTLLVVDPFYLYATEWEGFKMQESENGKYRLCDEVTEVAQAANMEIVMLCMKEFTKDDIEKYNALAMINEWIEESNNHDEMVLIQSETEFSQTVCDKYNADNIMITGIVTVKQKRENRGMIILFSVICYPLLPVGLVWALTPEHETYIITGIYNVPTSNTQMSRVTRLKSRARSGYVASQLYDILSGIRRDPETNKKQTR